MKSVLVSIRDDLTGYISLVPAPSVEVAKRDFSRICSDSSSLMYSNPGDYRLYELGSFDSDSGLIISHEPVFVCSGLDFRKEVVTDVD